MEVNFGGNKIVPYSKRQWEDYQARMMAILPMDAATGDQIAADTEFKNLLNTQHDEYQNIFDRTQEMLIQKNEGVEDTPMMQKAMSWMGIQMNTLTDESDSKLSELLIQGNDMGIVKGTKILNDYSYMNKEIKNVLSDFIRLQEKNIDDLKRYL